MELVLVTGGSGYLACHVVQQLLQTGQYRVRATVRSLQCEEKVKPLRDLGQEAGSNILELVEADLQEAQSWPKATRDCTFVIHVASPFPMEMPSDESVLIKPAVEGTLNVLRAAHESRTVRRVVLTSSVAAIMDGCRKTQVSEDDWSDISECGPYSKSKTLAEKAAWDFVNQLPASERFELAVMNPGFILGPALTTAEATSMQIIRRVLLRDMPLLPRLYFSVVDVRDAALAHVKALTAPGAAGSRHILAPHSAWLKDIALILAEKFDPLGYNVPTKEAPYCLMLLASLFDSSIKGVLKSLGKQVDMKSCRMTDVLQVEPHELKDTIITMAEDLIQRGIIPKKKKSR